VSEDGKKATRHPIKLGTRNRDYYEVLSGLRSGDVVVISSYSAFDKAQTLYFN
jgi:HlyD family secretion protein